MPPASLENVIKYKPYSIDRHLNCEESAIGHECLEKYAAETHVQFWVVHFHFDDYFSVDIDGGHLSG